MDIMDPYTSELLAAAALPGAFSGCATDDDYLRAIGALPRRPSAGLAPASVVYPSTLQPSSVMLPASYHLLGAHATQLAAEAPVPPSAAGRKRAAPASDIAASETSAKRPRPCPWVPDYDADIDINLREKERNIKRQPSPDYLRNVQRDRIDERTRSSLVIWMDEFAQSYHLPPGTLHRAVAYVDRVLSARALSSDDTDRELRLLGAAALFTAAKYEARSTVLTLNATEVAGYCGFATGKEVTDMEREMLATLRYELGGSTAFTFVEHFTRHSRGEKSNKIRLLAHQLADTSLFDYRCLQFMPSAVAATALFLARLTYEPAADNEEYIEDKTGYKPMDLIDGLCSVVQDESQCSLRDRASL